MEYQGVVESNKVRAVVKSNRIIEAKYRLNIREQKFILYMVSLIQPDDKDFKFYRVKINEFEKILNLEGKKWGNIYQVVKDIVFSLNEKPLLIAKEDGKKQIINWIASAEIEAGSGVIEFEFSEKLKPYLLQLKSHFTKYNLENILQLKSSFSIRLYELLKSHQFQGKVEYELEELKRLLGVNDKYDEYNDFKKRVLTTAQKELQLKSDIYFDYKEKRVNRRIASILFSIFDNKDVAENKKTVPKLEGDAENLFINDHDSNTDLIVQLVDIGFTKAKAEDLLSKGFELIKDAEMRQKIEGTYGNAQKWFEERILFFDIELKKGKISNPQGYFLKSLEDNYTNIESVKQLKNEAVKQKNQEIGQEKNRLESLKKTITDNLWSKKIEITVDILTQKPTFLDELNYGNGATLFKGEYDNSLTVVQNFSKAAIYNKARVVSLLEKHTPQYFEHLSRLEYELGEVNRQLTRL